MFREWRNLRIYCRQSSGTICLCLALLFLLFSRSQAFASDEASDRLLSSQQLRTLATKLVPRKKSPAQWAEAIWQALDEAQIRPRKSNLCSVLAVIEQESNFEANPQVKNLGRISEAALLEKLKGVPFLSSEVMAFLESKPDPRRNYLKLIRAAKTERDLDVVWRNITYYLFSQYATVALMSIDPFKSLIEKGNEVKTIGSMQVSLAFARSEVERQRGRPLNLARSWQLRDELYTLDGGVRYGARMLLGYYANYPSKLYVFADYNAGRYASRNAAFQFIVGKLSDHPLALDGDLLIYEEGAISDTPSKTEIAIKNLSDQHGLSLTTGQIRRDLKTEKSYQLVDTRTYTTMRQLYTTQHHEAPPYAKVPEIQLSSPKLSHSMSTERFARSVYWRFVKCMQL